MLSHEQELIQDATGVSDPILLDKIEDEMRASRSRGLGRLWLVSFNRAAKKAHKNVLKAAAKEAAEDARAEDDTQAACDPVVDTLRAALTAAQTAARDGRDLAETVLTYLNCDRIGPVTPVVDKALSALPRIDAALGEIKAALNKTAASDASQRR
jgi:hypothetical protein